MTAAAGQHPWAGGRVGQLSDRIRLNPGGVHDRSCRPALLPTFAVFTHRPGQPARLIPFEPHHSATGLKLCPALFSAQCQQQIQPGVIKLPVAVGNPAQPCFELW